MTPDTRTLALAIGLGVSLAACGGGDGNGAPDSTTATSKALPAGTPNTTASPAASSTQASSARTIKATESDPVIRKAPQKYNGVEYEIRGDALIQALLTSVIPRDEHNEVQMAWLDGYFGSPLPIYPLPAKPVLTSGSAQLVTEDIAPDTGGSLGSP